MCHSNSASSDFRRQQQQQWLQKDTASNALSGRGGTAILTLTTREQACAAAAAALADITGLNNVLAGHDLCRAALLCNQLGRLLQLLMTQPPYFTPYAWHHLQRFQCLLIL